MTTLQAQKDWIANLPQQVAVSFLARLSWEITIAGRNSYEAGTNELTNPRQLRRVNEIQHRVTACLSQLLEHTCRDGFVVAIAQLVLAEEDVELRGILQGSWLQAREYVETN